MAESEFADHHTSVTAELTCSDDETLSNVKCWPAKLALAPSSPTADDRTASGARSGRTAAPTCSIALSSPLATASAIVPDSAMPGGSGKPPRAASPSPTAFEPKTEWSRASWSETTPVTLLPSLHRRRRRRALALRREYGRSRRG